MRNIELLIQIKEIESVINNKIKTTPPNKTALQFEVASYSKKEGFYPSILKKEKNTLLTFGTMSDFVLEHININDYILIKGDLREVSTSENVFLPLSIRKMDDKRKRLQITSK